VAESRAATLTFLFTDLEGSTRLWEDHPEAMRDALARHDDLLHDAVARHDGQVVKSTGDGAFAIFTRPQDGVAAAVDAQKMLAATRWPAPVELRVRMGIHTGQATERRGDWYGADVNRAARVMAVANGGQIVCTRAVGELVRASFATIDLGEHRLRDLQSSVHLFQVDVPGQSGDHPPLRSLDAYRSNLPHQLSSFVGRDDAVRSVGALLANYRVVSIVGVGGVGKTRVALQVGSEVLPHFADGVWFCELASISEPGDVPDAIASAVGYTPSQGVSVADGLQRFLERKRLLLVLDNCEHVIGAVTAFVAATTTHAAGVSVLATSREALAVHGEHVAPLASLDVPSADDAESVLTSEAGQLFVARAAEARGDLVLDEADAAAVRGLCIRLDGIPLAIELAAAQARMMSPREISSRLDKQFRLVAGSRRGALERHQTLRAAIDWSYELLTDDERTLLQRLSSCVGGFDLDAAVAISASAGIDEFDAVDLLGSLVTKSLVERTERDGTTRYRLLEMIRQFADERLAATEDVRAARDAHARHYLALTVQCFAEARTEREFEALEMLEIETANIVAASRWLLADDRLDEIFSFFDSLPFVDPFALPATLLDELAAIAVGVTDRPGVAGRPGFDTACFLDSAQCFTVGDMVRYRHIDEIARRDPNFESAMGARITQSTLAFFDGDTELLMAASQAAVDAARRNEDPIALAWTLAHQATTDTRPREETSDEHEMQARATTEDALANARRSGSRIAPLYPLVAVSSAFLSFDPHRARDAADEVMALDRTARRWWADVARSTSVNVRFTLGDIGAALALQREVMREAYEKGERFILSSHCSFLASVLIDVDLPLAVGIAAIAESDAIAPFNTFAAQPALLRRAREIEPLIPAAREQASRLSYDEAFAFAIEAIDRVIADPSR
jgi:predicted ATPase/class 3 adenylate cyclase